MLKKIIRYLKTFRCKFKKLWNILRSSDREKLVEVLPRVFRKLQKWTGVVHGESFLQLLERVAFPEFWLKLGKNTIYKLKEYFYFLIFLSAFSITAESGAQMLDVAAILGPDADTLLYHLSKFSFQEVQSIMEKLNAVIFQEARRHFQRGFWKKAVPIAIDFTDLPFYGKKSVPGIVGGKKKASTHWHYRFIALTIIQKQVRFTLAVLPVLPFDTTVPLLKRLIKKAEQFIQIKYIEADRGFFTKEVIHFFMQRNYKFLMPAVKNDRIKEKIRAFHAGKIAPSFQYQFKKKNSEKENETFTVFITKAETKKKKSQKPRKKTKKRQTLFELYHVFATNKKLRKQSTEALQKVADQYRARWGIETGFKMVNFFRIKTTSTNFVIRVFFYLFAVVIYNLWVLYNLLHRHKRQKRYTLPTPRVKMLLLLKALQILDKIGDEKVQKLTGGDSP